MTDKASPSVADNLQRLLNADKDEVSVDEIIARAERREGLAVIIGLVLLAAAAIVWGLRGARLGVHRLFGG